MSNDEQEPPTDSDRVSAKRPTRWFAKNEDGPGWHPRSWRGWLLLGGIVCVLIVIVLKTAMV